MLYANTKKQGLVEHLICVGIRSSQIVERQTKDKKLSEAAYIAGCLHDIGKLDEAYQSWTRNYKTNSTFSFDKHAKHNEISLLLFDVLYNRNKSINTFQHQAIRHAIYWHHAKPIRKKEYKTTSSIHKKYKEDLTADVKVFWDVITAIDAKSSQQTLTTKLSDFFQSSIEQDIDLNTFPLPTYKKYNNDNETYAHYQKDININAKLDLVRSAVIVADREVSGWDEEQLNFYIGNTDTTQTVKASTLQESIETMLTQFGKDTERSKVQTEIADSLGRTNVAVLSGPAGCGKTKVALEWARNTEVHKIIWIAPRVQICQGLFADLTSSQYLPNNRVEVLTGSIKQTGLNGVVEETVESSLFTGDIVITTIDQLVNAISTHKSSTRLIKYMDYHVVFDEYHEYANLKGLNILFAELVQCKKLARIPNTLLVSATINPDFTNNFLDIEDIVYMGTFNKSEYKFKWEEFNEASSTDSNPFYKEQPKSTFLISNTATTAQKAYFKNEKKENSILLHSKYTAKDRSLLFSQTFKAFKEKGTKEFDVLRAGPVVQASLNITCDNMITETTTPENWLQRLGRLNRFSENKQVSLYTTLVSVDGKKGSNYRFLTTLGVQNVSFKWTEFISERLQEEVTTLPEVYQLYQEFYNTQENVKVIQKEFLKTLEKSVQVVSSKIQEPVKYAKVKKKQSLKKSSIRGNSRYVAMAVCERNSAGVRITEEYTEEGQLTMNVPILEGQGDSSRSLLAFMAKKHHSIFNVKKVYKDFLLLNNARQAETPIYTSYTECDLAKVNSLPHPYAQYYLKGLKHPIGGVSKKNMEKAIDTTLEL